ncbi:MAG TPA: phosphocholine cytidylyltransferase family protein [Vicinamibacterales bacterium]|nr:phosphocholine cytidylyltransferase family protein [Vicinamibacterales bacterium]
MRAIILAAGAGTRLNGCGRHLPKCLADMGGRPLIDRQLAMLHAAGIEDVTVVVGFGAAQVRRACGSRVDYVDNLRYARTNSLYSLWLARRRLAGGAVILNCDVLFHPRLLDDLLGARYPDALLVAPPDPGAGPYGDEEMKVKIRAGRIVDMRKDLPPHEADGENVGMVKVGGDGAALLADLLDRLVAAGGARDWAPRAFLELARRRPIFAVGTRGLPWIEIDTPDDYARARREIWPAIAPVLDQQPAGGRSPAPRVACWSRGAGR